MNILSIDYSSLMNCTTKTKRKQQKKNTEEQRKVTYSDVTGYPNSKYWFNLEKRFWWKISKTNIQEGQLESFKFSGENKYVLHKVKKSKALLISKIFTSIRR